MSECINKGLEFKQPIFKYFNSFTDVDDRTNFPLFSAIFIANILPNSVVGSVIHVTFPFNLTETKVLNS